MLRAVAAEVQRRCGGIYRLSRKVLLELSIPLFDSSAGTWILEEVCPGFLCGKTRVLHRKRSRPFHVPNIGVGRALICCRDTDIVEKQVVCESTVSPNVE